MAITSIDQINTALKSAQRVPILKADLGTNSLVNVPFWSSTWMCSGWPTAGAVAAAYNSGSGYTCDSTTTGAWPYVNGATQNYLARMYASGVSGPNSASADQRDQLIHVVIADRLWACASIGTVNGTYTVTTPGSLPARITDNGVGCELWREQSVNADTAAGSATTISCAYLNTAGSSKTSGTISLQANNQSPDSKGSMEPFPLQVGDLGVKQLTSVTLAGQALNAGTVGITILKRLCGFTIPRAHLNQVLDWARLGLPRLPDNVCLFAIISCPGRNSANTGAVVQFGLDIIDL